MTPHVAELEPESLTPFAKLSTPRKLSYGLFVGLIALSALLNLGPMALSGLFAFLILDFSHRRLSKALPAPYARLAACVIFIVAGFGLGWIFLEFLRQALAAMPHILANALPRLADMLDNYGINLPFETRDDFREALLTALKENAFAVTRLTGLLTRRFFHIVAGIIIAILCFFARAKPAQGPTFYDATLRELHDRLVTFMRSFELVFGAQIVVSSINTVLTTVYLLAVGIPFLGFLIPATFVLGLLPVIGNVASNTLIIAAALTLSPKLAMISLIFLVVMHKAQYLINGHFLGSSLESPMWLILIGIIVGELLMGVPGIVLAPALLHYLRVELQALPHESRPL